MYQFNFFIQVPYIIQILKMREMKLIWKYHKIPESTGNLANLVPHVN